MYLYCIRARLSRLRAKFSDDRASSRDTIQLSKGVNMRLVCNVLFMHFFQSPYHCYTCYDKDRLVGLTTIG